MSIQVISFIQEIGMREYEHNFTCHIYKIPKQVNFFDTLYFSEVIFESSVIYTAESDQRTPQSINPFLRISYPSIPIYSHPSLLLCVSRYSFLMPLENFHLHVVKLFSNLYSKTKLTIFAPSFFDLSRFLF